MVSIPRQLGLYISNGNSRTAMCNFAFYIAVQSLSHEGVIHKYRKIIPILCSRMGISDSTFRKRVGECKRDGLLFEDEAKGLRFISAKKYLDIEKNKYPFIFSKTKKKKRITGGKRKYFTEFKKYDDLVIWIRSLIIFNKSSQCNYAENKAISKNGTNNDNLITPSAFQKNSFSLSRKSIASLINLSSNTGATYFMKKLSSKGICIMDKGRIKRIKPISKYEYNEVYVGKPGFYFDKGYLMRRMCNEIKLKTNLFMMEMD